MGLLRRFPRWARIAGAVLVVAAVAVWWATRRTPLVTLRSETPSRVLIREVLVVDVLEGKASGPMDVVLAEGLIAKIVPHPSQETAATVIEGNGARLVPGLIDVHCHLMSAPTPPWVLALPDARGNLERQLFSGVVRVLDPGAPSPDIFELRDDVNAGRVVGPTVHAAGPLFTAPGGHPAPLIEGALPWPLSGLLVKGMTRQVGTEQEAIDALTALREKSPDFVKVVVDRLPDDAPSIDPRVATALVREATAHGLRTVAHIGATSDALAAGRAGVAAWLHGVYKERIPDAAIAELADFHIPMAPTLVVFDSYGLFGRGDYPPTPLEEALVSRDGLDARNHVPEGWPEVDGFEAFVDNLNRQRATALDNVRRLSAAGVVILAGSDAQAGVIHGASLHRELALLAKAGLTPIDVLRAATLNNARFLAGQPDPPYGVVSVGKRADLLLVRGDPLESVAALGAIEGVILGGVPVERVGIARAP